MPCVRYWPVGTTNDTTLPLTTDQICQVLLADWLPTLPFAASRSVLGWPNYLITADPGRSPSYLYLESVAGWSDRQWKGVLSWMLGIAGTRRVLDNEGYVWIAPTSAFYPERKQDVATPSWNTSYPPSVLEISSDPNNGSRIRPDYIAARLSASGIDFALVESKGTKNALNNLSVCPADWARQARNAIVKINGSVVTVPRNLVVATRCNPNAKRRKYRQLQVRAWNSNSNSQSQNFDILFEVASACYAGLCRNLGLWANLRALQISASSRLTGAFEPDSQFTEIEKEADAELSDRGHWEPSGKNGAHFKIDLDVGTIHVQVAKIALSLIRFIRSFNSKDTLVDGITHGLHDLMDWYLRTAAEYEQTPNIAIDRSGFIVKTEGMQVASRP